MALVICWWLWALIGGGKKRESGLSTFRLQYLRQVHVPAQAKIMFHNHQEEYAPGTHWSSWYANAVCLGCSRQKKASANRLTCKKSILQRQIQTFRHFISAHNTWDKLWFNIQTKLGNCHSEIVSQIFKFADEYRSGDSLLVYGAPWPAGRQHSPVKTPPRGIAPRGPSAESRVEPGSCSQALPIHQGSLLFAMGIKSQVSHQRAPVIFYSHKQQWRYSLRHSLPR